MQAQDRITTIVPQNNQVQQPTQATKDAPTLSRVLASKLLLGNHCMIKCSRLAVEKANNEQVREFAEMLAKEHAECINSLKSLAPQSFVDEFTALEQNPAGASKSNADRTAQNQQQVQAAEARHIQQTQTADRTRSAGGEANLRHQLCEIEKSATLKKSEAGQKMLKECSDEDFDTLEPIVVQISALSIRGGGHIRYFAQTSLNRFG